MEIVQVGDEKMRTVDLFCGCGGLSLGFQNAGFNLVGAFEYWDKAVECYSKNFTHPVTTIDLSDTTNAIKEISTYSPDIIIGGPPCQDFSHAGKRIESTRASLTESYAEIVTTIRPTYFVMENVDRAQSSKAFEKAKKLFKDSGYGITEMILDASKCGVPQKRKRLFCIGAMGREDDFLKEFLEKSISDTPMTLRKYFGDALDFEYYYRHPRNYSRRAVFSIDEPAPTIRGVNRPVPKGYPGHPNDACKITDGVRALSTLERSLIQTFPATYQWCGNKTEMEQMIGNAVPVKLAEFVASALKTYIDSQTNDLPDNLKSFENWLINYKTLSARTASDTVSRVKRANRIHRLSDTSENMYLFYLQNENEFSKLTTSVRSQIKRAVSLYYDFSSPQLRLEP